VLAAVGAALYMDNLPQRWDAGALRDVLREPHTWIVSVLYIGTFGSFIGFSFAFGQVLQIQFHTAASVTFLGPLLGSLARPVGGALADRLGGARVTFAAFLAMAVAASLVLAAARLGSLPFYLVGFVALFVLSGLGNGSTYKMIPAAFAAKYGTGPAARRLSGALIGLAGAIGAFGGVLVNLAFRQSFLAYKSADAAYLAFIAYYLLCVVILGLRRSRRRSR